MRSAIAVVLLGVLAGVVLWLARRCRHEDDDGGSTLMWSWRNGRLCGYCDQCGRWTTGWPVVTRSWWID